MSVPPMIAISPDATPSCLQGLLDARALRIPMQRIRLSRYGSERLDLAGRDQPSAGGGGRLFGGIAPVDEGRGCVEAAHEEILIRLHDQGRRDRAGCIGQHAVFRHDGVADEAIGHEGMRYRFRADHNAKRNRRASPAISAFRDRNRFDYSTSRTTLAVGRWSSGRKLVRFLLQISSYFAIVVTVPFARMCTTL